MAAKYLVLAFAAFIVQAAASCSCNKGQRQVFSTQNFFSLPEQLVTNCPCGSQQLVSSPVQEQYVVISPQPTACNSPCGCQASQQYVTNAPKIVASSPCGCQSQQYVTNAPQIVAGCPCGCQSQQYAVNAPQIVASSPCGCQSQQIVSSQACPQVKQACASPLYATPVVATTLIDNSVSNSLANALQLLIVSDLIESTLNARDCCTNQVVPFCDGPIVDCVPACQQSCNGPVEIDYVDSYCPVEYYNNCYQEQCGPNVAEVVFPTSVPAQLVCQLPYVPTAMPLVNYDVQPFSSGCGCGCGQSSGSCCGCGCGCGQSSSSCCGCGCGQSSSSCCGCGCSPMYY